MSTPIPYDPEAERALIGALVVSRYQAETIRAMVASEDFHDPVLGKVYAAYMGMIDEGIPTDVVTIAARADVSRAWLGQVMADTPASANVVGYARIVVELASRRRYIAASSEILHAASNAGIDYADIAAVAEEALRKAELPVAGIAEGDDLEQFIALASLEPDWIIPGLISRQDRILLVAGEGHGKSVLLQQVLICAAAGVHPFGRGEIPPVRVMIVDLENPQGLLRRRMKKMWETIEPLAAEPLSPANSRIITKPEGVDIASRSGEMWLSDQLNHFQPDILAIGPAYKLHESEEEKSKDVRRVLVALDRLRIRFRCALLVETHAPHESFRKGPNGERPKIRPAGSRLWIRWPEMVLGLEPQADHRLKDGEWRLSDVRPPCEERDWPKKLRRGSILPWVDVTDRDAVWGDVG